MFERDELVRLLAESDALLPDIPTMQRRPVEAMNVQEIMDELEDCGIEYNVLAPRPVLSQKLREARGYECRAPESQQTTPVDPYDVPYDMPGEELLDKSRGSHVGSQPEARATQPRRDAATAARLANEESLRRSRRASDDLDPAAAWDEAQRELYPVIADAVGGVGSIVGEVIEQLKPATSKAVSATTAAVSGAGVAGGGLRDRLLARARRQLRRFRPPPKPVLLALCVGALRFGVVKTALAAASAKLTIEVARDAATALRARGSDGDDDDIEYEEY